MALQLSSFISIVRCNGPINTMLWLETRVFKFNPPEIETICSFVDDFGV